MIDLTPPCILKKIIAKEIIVLKPFSITKWGQFLQEKLKIPVKEADVAMQNWALAQSDYFSEKDWRVVQFKKLKKILCHAGKNVSYWETLFKKVGFNPEKMCNIDDFRKVPITDRSELKKNSIENLLAKNISKTRRISAATSGSTGEPFQFYQDERDVFRRYINNFQEFRYIGVNNDDPIFIIGLNTHGELNNSGSRIYAYELENDKKRRDSIYPLIRSLRPRLLMSLRILSAFYFFAKKMGFVRK